MANNHPNVDGDVDNDNNNNNNNNDNQRNHQKKKQKKKKNDILINYNETQKMKKIRNYQISEKILKHYYLI